MSCASSSRASKSGGSMPKWPESDTSRSASAWSSARARASLSIFIRMREGSPEGAPLGFSSCQRAANPLTLLLKSCTCKKIQRNNSGSIQLNFLILSFIKTSQSLIRWPESQKIRCFKGIIGPKVSVSRPSQNLETMNTFHSRYTVPQILPKLINFDLLCAHSRLVPGLSIEQPGGPSGVPNDFHAAADCC